MTQLRSSFLTIVAMAPFIYPAQVFAVEGEGLVWALMYRPLCEKHMAGFAAKSKPAYENLRRTDPETFATFESKPPIVADLSVQPDERELLELQTQCKRLLDGLLDIGRPPDPRLATPEQTWKLFVGALRSADHETLATCFAPGARANYARMFQQLNPSQLLDMANSITHFELQKSPIHEDQEAVVTKSDNTAGFVRFVKTSAGWRISHL